MNPLVTVLVDAAAEELKDALKERIKQELDEREALGPEALQYVEARLDEVDKRIGAYFKAYDKAQTAAKLLGQPLSGNETFIQCRQYMRLPEIAALDATIRELRAIGQVSATLEDEAIMRIEAHMEMVRMERDEWLENHEVAKARSNDPNFPLAAEAAGMAAIQMDFAVGRQKMFDRFDHQQGLVEDKGYDMQQRVANQIGALHEIKEDMKSITGPYIPFDVSLCREYWVELSQ